MKRTACIFLTIMLLIFTAGPAAAALGTVKQLTLHGACWNGEWSPDGQWVVYQRGLTDDNGQPGVTIWKIKADGTGETKLTQKGAKKYFCDSHPTWSPDGRWVAFQRNELAPTASKSSDHRTSIWKVGSDGSGEVRVARYQLLDYNQDQKNEGSGAQIPAWSSDGQWIAFRYGDGAFEESYSRVNVVRPDGTGSKRISPAGFGFDPHVDDLQWKPAGTGGNTKLLASLINPGYFEQGEDNGDRNLAILDTAAPATAKWITNGYGYTCQQQMHWKPNGTKIVYMDDTYDEGDIWTMNANGTGKVRLTNSAVDSVLQDVQLVCYNHPIYSPDGSRIAFFERVSNGTGDDEHYIDIMNENGSKKVRLTKNLTDAAFDQNLGAWVLSFNKQGTKLLFGMQDKNGNHQLWTLALPAQALEGDID